MLNTAYHILQFQSENCESLLNSCRLYYLCGQMIDSRFGYRKLMGTSADQSFYCSVKF